jgi:hypothetical protein
MQGKQGDEAKEDGWKPVVVRATSCIQQTRTRPSGGFKQGHWWIKKQYYSSCIYTVLYKETVC